MRAYSGGMLIAFSIYPLGSGESVSDAVAESLAVVRDSGITHSTDSMFTTLEGSWDDCMGVIKRCTEVMAEHHARIEIVMKADIRPGHEGEMAGKVERVATKLDAIEHGTHS